MKALRYSLHTLAISPLTLLSCFFFSPFSFTTCLPSPFSLHVASYMPSIQPGRCSQLRVQLSLLNVSMRQCLNAPRSMVQQLTRVETADADNNKKMSGKAEQITCLSPSGSSLSSAGERRSRLRRVLRRDLLQ